VLWTGSGTAERGSFREEDDVALTPFQVCCNFNSMTRTQIQLPDELYQRAKRFAEQRELSLAEITRRGLELFLARFPEGNPPKAEWNLPVVRAGGLKVPLEKLRDITNKEEEARAFHR
jgi:hypothetical protein